MRSSSRLGRGGFSLVEMLVVIGVVSILIALLAPAISGVKGGVALTGSAASLVDTFDFARQSAITTNRSVEVRIYEKSEGYSVALFEDGVHPPRQLDRAFRLPLSIVIGTQSGSWSSLLSDTVSNGPVDGGVDGTYYAFKFQPDGSTNLGGSIAPTLTLILRRDQNSADLPSDFVTLQIDQLTGMTRVFRPS